MPKIIRSKLVCKPGPCVVRATSEPVSVHVKIGMLRMKMCIGGIVRDQPVT